MTLLTKSPDEIDAELVIDNSSLAALEQELINQPRKEAVYQRLAAIANKNVSKLQLDLEIVITEIIKEICIEAEARKKPIASSAITELRKTHIPGDKRYQKLKSALIDAYEELNLINGLVSAWISRGYRLQELVKLAERAFFNPTVYGYGDKFKTAGQRLDQAGESLEE
jgi:hypothetical protein